MSSPLVMFLFVHFLAFSCKIVWHFSFAHTHFCEGQGSMWVQFSCYTSDNIRTITEKMWSVYRIAGNIQGRELLWVSWFCGYLNFWGLASFGGGGGGKKGGKSEQSAKVFSMKIVFFTNSQTFSPQKFSAIYGTCTNFNILLAAPCLPISFQNSSQQTRSYTHLVASDL